MKKLTRKSLSELAIMLPVVENEIQTSFVGGGAGTRTDPFTLWEWEEMGTSFRKGWVEFSPNVVSYLTQDYYTMEVIITATCSIILVLTQLRTYFH